MSTGSPQISVVVCTHNRSRYLRKCIESLLNQNVDKSRYEIVVIDNNSTDDTRALCAEFVQAGNIRYIFEREVGLSRARNRGISEARAPLVAYTDDDAVALPGWIRELLIAFEDPEVGAAGGLTLPVYEKEAPGWFHESLLPLYSCKGFGDTVRDLDGMQFFFGVNMAFRKNILMEAGGFRVDLGRKGDDLLSDEELEISRMIEKTRYKKCYRPAAIVHHTIPKERLCIKWLLRRLYALGKGQAVRKLDTDRSLFARVRDVKGRLMAAVMEMKKPWFVAGPYTRLIPVVVFFGYARVMMFGGRK